MMNLPGVSSGGDDGSEGVAIDFLAAGDFGEDESLEGPLGHSGYDLG